MKLVQTFQKYHYSEGQKKKNSREKHCKIKKTKESRQSNAIHDPGLYSGMGWGVEPSFYRHGIIREL